MTRRLLLALLPLAALAGCHQRAAPSNAVTATGPANVAATAPGGRDWATVVTRTVDTGYRMGNPAAPVQLVEFGSRTCPHCAAFAASASWQLFIASLGSGLGAWLSGPRGRRTTGVLAALAITALALRPLL